MESHPLVNKVIVSVGSRRGEGQAASSKKREKKQAQREEDREGEKKERDSDHRDHCLPTTYWV